MKFQESKIAAIRGGIFINEEYIKVRTKEFREAFIDTIKKDGELKSLKFDDIEQDDFDTIILISQKRKMAYKVQLTNEGLSFYIGTVDNSERKSIVESISKIYNIAEKTFHVSVWTTLGIEFNFAIPLKDKEAALRLTELHPLSSLKDTPSFGRADEFQNINLDVQYKQGEKTIRLRLSNHNSNDSIIIAFDQRISYDKVHGNLKDFYEEAWDNMEQKISKFLTPILNSKHIDEEFLKTGHPVKKQLKNQQRQLELKKR